MVLLLLNQPGDQVCVRLVLFLLPHILLFLTGSCLPISQMNSSALPLSFRFLSLLPHVMLWITVPFYLHSIKFACRCKEENKQRISVLHKQAGLDWEWAMMKSYCRFHLTSRRLCLQFWNRCSCWHQTGVRTLPPTWPCDHPASVHTTRTVHLSFSLCCMKYS